MNTLKKKKNLLIGFLTAVLIVCSAFFALDLNSASAEAINPTAERFLPLSVLETENTITSTPTHIYSDDDVTAFITGDTTTSKLTIYKNNQFSEISGESFKIIKKYDENTLLITERAILCKIELDNNNHKTQIYPYMSNQVLSANQFDINTQYLIMVHETTGYIYNNSVNGYTENTANRFEANGECPVAINANNEIFYVYENGLYKRDALGTEKEKKQLFPNTTPSKMIANETYVYYLNNNKIYKLDHTKDNPSPEELKINEIDKVYDLGTLIAPKGISFKGENLLISAGDTIQEYKIEDNQLTFTGFAIASGKTAYNRIKSNATDIEQYGNNVAVLDDFKITIYSEINATDRYARENFNNIIIENFGGYTPKKLAISNDKMLLSDASHTLKLLDLTKSVGKDGFIKDVASPTNAIINDITYQSGFFYVIAYNGTNTDVYKLSDKAESLSLNLVKTVNNYDATKMAVDVYGNVYLSNGTDVVKLIKSDDFSSSLLASGLTSVKKIQTDLGGGVFVLDDNQLKYLVENNMTAITITAPYSNIKSFAMDYVSDKVYFIYENEELITVSSNLPNIALSDLKSTAEFKTTGLSAPDALEIVKAIDGANVYSVSLNGDSFDFNGLIPSGSEYLRVCELEKVSNHASVKMLALAGENGIVLIDKTQAILSPVTQTDAISEEAFVTTDVSGYYFPIITENGEYALTDSNAKVRIDKATEIKPLKVLTFLNNEFYYAEFTHGDVKTHGYIPKAFTVEILSEDFTWNKYSIEKVKKTDFYSDEKLTAIHSIKPILENGDTVRIKSIKDGVCSVLVSDGNGGFIEGYIRKDAIKNDPNTAIRNILIILAVAACVCGTTAYFVIRRKQI